MTSDTTPTAVHVRSTAEVGQLVRVRGRIWAVTLVRRSRVEPGVLDAEAQRSAQHMGALASIEDDALGTLRWRI